MSTEPRPSALPGPAPVTVRPADSSAASDQPRPDARDALATERTSLAWVRVSLALSLVTIALAGWSPPSIPAPVVTVVGLLTGGGALVAAIRTRWGR